jgi:hypothetical protein
MRNKILVLLMFLFTTGKAQQGAAVFGIKGGITSSGLWGPDATDSLSNAGSPLNKLGFNIGIAVNSMVGKYIWLKHDLFLTQKGALLKIQDKYNAPYDSKLNLLYLDAFPCSPTFHFKGLQLFVGPYFGMLLSASMQHKDSSGVSHTENQIFGSATSFKNYTQKIDAGFIVGIEYEFNFGLNVGIRYVRGFVPLIENPLIQSGQSQIFNQNINLTIGYTFRYKE